MVKPQEFNLDSGFTYSVDIADENEWNAIVPQFRDATVNQTWAYGRVRSKGTPPSHLVLKRNGQVVAAAMTRIIALPVLKGGGAYVGSGPMWRLLGEADNREILRKILQALREEYVARRGLFLRISPNMFTNLPNHNEIRHVFEEEGYVCKDLGGTTLFLDLKPTLESLRKELHQKWRNLLNRAEKNGLTVREGTDDQLFRMFRGIYEEMLARKQYATDVDMNVYESIQAALPENLKPWIIICESEGRPTAGAVFSVNGDTGVYLLGATSDEGMKTKASYLVQWHMIKYLKKNGFRMYDLGGCSPEHNKGTYHFKAGICGKHPELSARIGTMESCDNPVSKIVVRLGEFLKRRR